MKVGDFVRIEYDSPESDVLLELSKRIKQYRISSPMTQEELSEKAGVSVKIVSKIENGRDVTVINLIKVLKAMNLQGHLEVLVPDETRNPAYYIDKENQRKRVRKRKTESEIKPWKWGDEK